MDRQGLDLGTSPTDVRPPLASPRFLPLHRPGTDPVHNVSQIYRNVIAEEEMRTGRPSQRRKEVDNKHALADRETNTVFIQRAFLSYFSLLFCAA